MDFFLLQYRNKKTGQKSQTEQKQKFHPGKEKKMKIVLLKKKPVFCSVASIFTMRSGPLFGFLKKNQNLPPVNYVDATDNDLILLYQKTGDTELVLVLLKKYLGPLSAICYGKFNQQADLEDFQQNLVIKLCVALKQTEVRNFKAWLSTAVRNMITDHFRAQKKGRNFVAIREGDRVISETEGTLKIDISKVKKAMNELSEIEKKCFEGKYVQGYSYKELMEMNAWTFLQVKGAIDRGKNKIRSILGREFENYFKDN